MTSHVVVNPNTPALSLNVIERAIALVSPRRALDRFRARFALENLANFRYDGAKTGRRTDGWITSNTSANSEIGPDLVLLRNRSRELIRNNHFANKASYEWRHKIVGHGITPRADTVVLAAWNRWMQYCSADGLPHFGAIQQMCAGSAFESGEVLVRFRYRRSSDRYPIPLQLQVLESDYLDIARNWTINGGYIVQGVQFDLLGQRQGYWLFGQHPGDTVRTPTRDGLSLTSQLIPASQVLHVFEPTRPGQVRGVPRLAPAMLALRDLDDYEDAELMRKKVEACFAAIVEQPEIDPIGKTSTDPETNRRLEQMQPGMIQYTRPGESIKFGSPAASGGYGEYKRAKLRDLCSAIGMPYEIVTGDLSQVNYSSYRGGLLSFRDAIEAYRWNVLIPTLCDGVWSEFCKAAYIAGEIPQPYYPVEWAPPPFELLDREAEAKADQLELQLATKSWPQAIAAKGLDPEKQIAEVTAWKSRIEAAGVILNPKANMQGQPNAENPPTAA